MCSFLKETSVICLIFRYGSQVSEATNNAMGAAGFALQVLKPVMTHVGNFDSHTAF